MSTIELEAKRMGVIKMLLNVNDVVLTEIEELLHGVDTEEVPFQYSPEALRKVVLQSEEAIRNGQVFTSAEIRAIHPRL